MKTALCILPLLLSGAAHATSIKELKLQCSGTYVVTSAKPFIMADESRYPKRYTPQAEAGANETIQITSLTGPDCNKLEPYYGLKLSIGQSLNYSALANEATEQAAEELVAKEMGSSHAFEVTQQFLYEEKSGELPLFPLVHKEYAYVLGLVGEANAQKLYGVPSFENLTDVQIGQVNAKVLNQLDYGLKFKNGDFINEWLDLFLKLTPHGEEEAKAYMSDLVLIFKNMTKDSSFVYGEAVTLVGGHLNALLSQYGATKWETKLHVLSRAPSLLAEEIFDWSRQGEGLQLSPEEIEAFLQESLKKVQDLAHVPQITDALILMNQYQEAAKTLKKFETAGFFAGFSGVTYVVTPHAQDLIEKILTTTPIYE